MLQGFTAEGRWMSCPVEGVMLLCMHALHTVGELDRVLQQQRLFIRETRRRIERTLDPGLAEREAAKQASLPIWAR